MSARKGFHSFVSDDATPLIDRWNVDWEEIERMASLVTRTPIRPQPHTYRRNR
jgi:hypothetical protein